MQSVETLERNSRLISVYLLGSYWILLVQWRKTGSLFMKLTACLNRLGWNGSQPMAVQVWWGKMLGFGSGCKIKTNMYPGVFALCRGKNWKQKLEFRMRKGKDVPELSNAELKPFTQTLNPTLTHLTKTKPLDLCHQTWKKKWKTANPLIQLEAKWK